MTERVTQVAAPPTAVVVDQHSYVDWCAIAAGTALAVAISLIFIAFGSAVGLTLVSPFEGQGMSAAGMAIAAALWFLWVQVSSFLAGGYLAGRLRRRAGDGREQEVDVRDGSHGLLVWATGVILMTIFAATAVGVSVTGTAVAVGSQADAVTARSDYYVDRLLRADPTAEAQASDASTAQAEIGRILAQSAMGTRLGTDDRSYVASLVAARTGLSQETAEQRVDQVAAEARIAADKARKFGIIVAFIVAATMVVSAMAAWWSAQWGGSHRDQGTVLALFTRWT